MRRLAAVLAALSLVAGAGTAAGARGVPPFPRIPGAWSHVEINVTLARQPHTLILDRGRIVQASLAPLQITLLESDGTTWTIPLTQQTIVMVNGRRATVYNLRKRMMAETLRVDGGAAVRVRAVAPRR